MTVQLLSLSNESLLDINFLSSTFSTFSVVQFFMMYKVVLTCYSATSITGFYTDLCAIHEKHYSFQLLSLAKNKKCNHSNESCRRGIYMDL